MRLKISLETLSIEPMTVSSSATKKMGTF